uniref:Uncharacterized protein n=1 Tax=Acrobeloides nanus TaxID=290746 RepID=A0A914EP55_9BILA
MLRKSLVDFLSVRCSADQFTVQMDYDLNRKPSRLTATLSDIIWRSRLCLDDKPGCCSQIDEIEKRLLISTPYHACNIKETTYASGFNYTATVKFTTNDNTKLYYTVTCRVPFRKEVSEPVVELIPADPQLKINESPLPLNTFIIGNVFPSDVTKEFHSFPLQCWTSVNGSAEKKTIILNGCPMTDLVPDQLVSVYQDKLAEKSSFHYAEWTKFVLSLDEKILPRAALER